MGCKDSALDAAIKHEMAVVERTTAIKLRTEYHYIGMEGTKVPDRYDENIEYHKNLVKWLKELKRLRNGNKNNIKG